MRRMFTSLEGRGTAAKEKKLSAYRHTDRVRTRGDVWGLRIETSLVQRKGSLSDVRKERERPVTS